MKSSVSLVLVSPLLLLLLAIAALLSPVIGQAPDCAGVSAPVDGPGQAEGKLPGGTTGCQSVSSTLGGVQVPLVLLPMVNKSLPPPTPTPTPLPGPVIVNGGFEAGHTGWAEYSSNGYYIILDQNDLPVPPHMGSWATWFGGAYDEASIIEQTVSIPNDRFILHYWFWIASQDVCNADYDIAGVLVNGEAVDAYILCEPNNTNGWVQRSVNLAQYAGKQATLTFAAFTDSVLNSNLFIDDISMQVTVMAPSQQELPITSMASVGKSSQINPDSNPLPPNPYQRTLREFLTNP